MGAAGAAPARPSSVLGTLGRGRVQREGGKTAWHQPSWAWITHGFWSPSPCTPFPTPNPCNAARPGWASAVLCSSAWLWAMWVHPTQLLPNPAAWCWAGTALAASAAPACCSLKQHVGRQHSIMLATPVPYQVLAWPSLDNPHLLALSPLCPLPFQWEEPYLSFNLLGTGLSGL